MSPTHNEKVRVEVERTRRLTVLRILADVPADARLRLQILSLLRRLPGYSSNSSELNAALDACDLRVSREAIRAAGAWLAQHALVTREDRGAADILVATRTGVDVARGTTAVAGVARPATIAWLQAELAGWGIGACRDDLTAWLAVLADGEMVMVDDQVTLTARGEDVAAGLLPHPDVAAPSPRD